MTSSPDIDQMTLEQLRTLAEQALQFLSQVDSMGQKIHRLETVSLFALSCWSLVFYQAGTHWQEMALTSRESSTSEPVDGPVLIFSAGQRYSARMALSTCGPTLRREKGMVEAKLSQCGITGRLPSISNQQVKHPKCRSTLNANHILMGRLGNTNGSKTFPLIANRAEKALSCVKLPSDLLTYKGQ